MKKLCILVSIIMFFVGIFGFSFKIKDKAQNTNINNNFKYSTIIIDAGHGGFDGGAVSKKGIIEKDINLKVTLYIKDYLDLMGYDVILTRNTDCSLEDNSSLSIRQRKTSDIHNRFRIMEENDDSLFISIHQNFYTQEQYSGMQVFYSPDNAEISSLLAQEIQQNTINFIQEDNTRQIKSCSTSVYLIYNAVVPAVLVECGFLSNEEEATKLSNTNYQKDIAYAITIGIINFINS